MRVERIGNATLYLADATEMERPAYDCVITDPPYGMEFRSNHRLDRYDPITNDTDSWALRWACLLPMRHSRYVFCRWDNFPVLTKLNPHSAITWVKNNWSMGDLEHEHARQTEMILFWAGEHHQFPNGRPTDVVYASRTGNGNHGTEKPVNLIEKMLSWTEGAVFDPFMGSGTTGVACVKQRRQFIGVEIEPAYFDIACQRIEEANRQLDLFLDPYADGWPDAAANSKGCYDEALRAIREQNQQQEG